MSREKLMTVLLSPHVSEKSARLAESGSQFVFKVRRDASKPEIKAAVELMFDVKVDAVRVANMPGKQKRFAQRLGKQSDFKKAYIRLAEGHTINFNGVEG